MRTLFIVGTAHDVHLAGMGLVAHLEKTLINNTHRTIKRCQKRKGLPWILILILYTALLPADEPLVLFLIMLENTTI
jgi:hypothetical protein